MSRHGFTSVQLTRINLPPQQLQRVPPDECWKLTWKKPKWWDMRDETACNTRHVKWRDMSTLLLHLLQGLLRDVLRSHILTILNSEHIYIYIINLTTFIIFIVCVLLGLACSSCSVPIHMSMSMRIGCKVEDGTSAKAAGIDPGS
jgi:hypothetical protein